MNTKITLSAICLILLFATSCKKDSGGGGSNAITGNWTFIGLTAHTQVTQNYAFAGDTYQTISLSDYTTQNNKGTVTISSSTMQTKDFSYSISSEINAEEYMNGSLIDNSSVPFDYTLPATSSSSTYKLIGTDSLYFPSGGIVSMNNGVTQPTQASGGRFTLSHDTLTIRVNLFQSTNQNVGGQSVISNVIGAEVVSLKRQ